MERSKMKKLLVQGLRHITNKIYARASVIECIQENIRPVEL